MVHMNQEMRAEVEDVVKKQMAGELYQTVIPLATFLYYPFRCESMHAQANIYNLPLVYSTLKSTVHMANRCTTRSFLKLSHEWDSVTDTSPKHSSTAMIKRLLSIGSVSSTFQSILNTFVRWEHAILNFSLLHL